MQDHVKTQWTTNKSCLGSQAGFSKCSANCSENPKESEICKSSCVQIVHRYPLILVETKPTRVPGLVSIHTRVDVLPIYPKAITFSRKPDIGFLSYGDRGIFVVYCGTVKSLSPWQTLNLQNISTSTVSNN